MNKDKSSKNDHPPSERAGVSDHTSRTDRQTLSNTDTYTSISKSFKKSKDKVIFIDRDGTLIIEPPETKQVNSLEELVFLPGVITALKQLGEAGFTLVIATNQDGLGTADNPRDNYEMINAKMLEVFKREGVEFDTILECPHFPKDNCGCRKPKTGMVDQYLNDNDIDLENSYMIGDRETDIEFSQNIGVQGVLLSEHCSWKDITEQILYPKRMYEIFRKTAETDIKLSLNLDGEGKYKISSKLRFLDHMLEQLAKHGGFDLEVSCKGDLDIDEHHTVEDIGIALGEAFREALGNKRGIERFAWERIQPMDDARVEVCIDLCNRPYFIFEGEFSREMVGDLPTELVEHFFRSFADEARINLQMRVFGKDTHHQVECCFKALARCLRDGVRRSGFGVPSTKGKL